MRLLATTARDPEIYALLLDMAADLESEAAALDGPPATSAEGHGRLQEPTCAAC